MLLSSAVYMQIHEQRKKHHNAVIGKIAASVYGRFANKKPPTMAAIILDDTELKRFAAEKRIITVVLLR